MSSKTFTLPTIDLGMYLNDKLSDLAIEECRKTARALSEYGALFVKDPYAEEDNNSEFLDLLEDYYAQPPEIIRKDERPKLNHQVGVTPELKEEPKCRRDPDCHSRIKKIPEEIQPLIPKGYDPKWRFYWNIGEFPEKTAFPQLNAKHAVVIPEAFKDKWPRIMDQRGNQLHQAVLNVVEMASAGFGMPPNFLPDLTKKGPHLLAPTGSDLNKYGKLGTILAGFHYDLAFITIHGKPRFPGLSIWSRDGRKGEIHIPDGHFLVQAGKQFEWLTGGQVEAGYHDVVVTKDTIKAIENAKKTRPDRPLWRVSSTLFMHVASDNILKPIEPYFKPSPIHLPILAGDQVQQGLGLIGLKKYDFKPHSTL